MKVFRVRVLAVVGAMFLGVTISPVTAAAGDSLSPRSTPGLTVNFTDPSGIALAGAAVFVYLTPFNPPADYAPTVLASGTADVNGMFSSTLQADGVVGIPGSWGDGIATIVNAQIRAVDPSMHWMVRYDEVLPIDAAATFSLAANIDLVSLLPPAIRRGNSSRSLASLSRVTHRENGRTQIGEATRDVKVLSWHVASGMSSTFTFSTGFGTYTQTAFSFPSGQPYKVGGENIEETSRTSTGSVAKTGALHQLRYAGYRFFLYRECGGRPLVCTDTWRPHNWTGALSTTASASQPAFDLSHAAILPQNGASRTSGQSNTFGNSFSLAGLSLSSRAAYFTNTKVTWARTTGCASTKTRYLYGQGADWPVAPIVYATCV